MDDMAEVSRHTAFTLLTFSFVAIEEPCSNAAVIVPLKTEFLQVSLVCSSCCLVHCSCHIFNRFLLAIEGRGRNRWEMHLEHALSSEYKSDALVEILRDKRRLWEGGPYLVSKPLSPNADKGRRVCRGYHPYSG